MNFPNFFAELKRRNVYKVAVAYIVAGWALSQGIAQVFPVFDVPNWIIRLIVLLVILGWPIALALAWMFEITPEGVKRTEHLAPDYGGSKSRTWIYIVILGALVSIGLFFLGRYSAENAAARSGGNNAIMEKSIAVLPLLNESGNPADEYFSDGLSEELIVALAQVSGLKVIGRSSSFAFKNKKEAPGSIGQKLGVSTLLEGTVRKQGERVRIVAELVSAHDGITLWTRTFERNLKDIFAVQQEIAAAVAESLQVTLLGTTNNQSAQSATASVEAHNAYLEGHFLFRRSNIEDFRKAITYFDHAIELDPNYAAVYAERAEVWTLLGDNTGQRTTLYPKARSDAEKAITLAPALAEAHAALGWVQCFTEWNFAEGLPQLQKAKDLAPANLTANDLLARIVAYLGRMDEAERQARQAVELDPLSVATQFNLARVLFYAGKLDEADACGRKVAEIQPTASSSHRWQVMVAVQRKDGEAALREAELEPNTAFKRFELTLAYYIRGEREAADATLAELIAKDKDRLAFQIAQAYALRGEKDKAFEWLQIGFDNHDGGILSLLVEPMLRGLRDDPRYHALLAKLGLPTANER